MMRTSRGRRTAGPLAVAWVFAGALAVALAQPSEAAAQSECAEYISGGPSNPASGRLIGSRLVTVTGGVSTGITASVSSRFYVGVYWMGDHKKSFRCDDYEPWGLM